jgi:hypothetical protein
MICSKRKGWVDERFDRESREKNMNISPAPSMRRGQQRVKMT